MTTKVDRKLDAYKAEAQHRALTLDRDARNAIDEEARTLELSFSSESPVERWFGVEVLGHGDGEIDLSRFENGAAVLMNHDTDDHIGVVESVRVEDGKGRASIRFGTSARADEVFRDVLDGIRRHVSVGYFVRDMVLQEQREEGPDEYRVTRWQPFEMSFVAVPADTNVGVGRSADSPPVVITEPQKEEKSMTDEGKVEDATREIDVKAAESAAREAARKSERERVSELLKTGEAYGAEGLARDAINGGHDVHWLNAEILKRNNENIEVVKAESPEIGMDDADVRKFSFVRLLNAMANPTDREAQREAGYEFDACAEAARKAKREAKGAMVPYDVLAAKRDQVVGTATQGGNLVATDLLSGSFIDMLRNKLALNQCGITMLTGLNGNIAIPRQTGGASAYWVAENGAPTESQATFDQVALSPETVGAYTEISRRLLKQSSIDIENFVMNELATTLGLEIDRVGINGSGSSNQPAGILNTGSIGDVAGGTNGLAPTWAHIVELETDVAVANADVGSMCYLTNAKVRGKLKTTALDAGSGLFVWDYRGSEPLNGYRTVVSNQVPSNLVKGSSGAVCSAIIFGNFADLIFGMWGGLDLQVNPYSLDTTGAVRVTAFQDCDFAVRHPESFSAMQDALTA